VFAAVGVLAALHRREATGHGDHLDIGMLDCQAALLGYQAAFYMYSGVVPGRQGIGQPAELR
jgi:crotonobetainyl-CoA:carnitine CoA-transferase CaiB-like acyl-CoA transferase